MGKDGRPISIEDAFSLYDVDGNGFISPGEFRQAIKNAGLQMTDIEIEICMRHADANGDGKISLQEFKDAITPPDEKEQLPEGWKRLTTRDGKNNTYYFHAATGTSSWTVPDENTAPKVAKPKKKAKKKKPVSNLPPGWTECLTTDGTNTKYYFHAETKQSSWTLPGADAKAADAKAAAAAVPAEEEGLADGWAECEDEKGNTYFYHAETKKSSWTKPESKTGTTAAQPQSKTAEEKSVKFEADTGLPEGWTELKTQDGKNITYYFHAASGKSSWTKPGGAAAAAQPKPGDLAPGWREVRTTDGTNKVYYYNDKTGKSSWTKPKKVKLVPFAEDRVRAVFCKMDIDQDGHLEEHEIKNLVGKSGLSSSQQLVLTLHTDHDGDGDGQLSPDEFVAMFRKKWTEDQAQAIEWLGWFEAMVGSWGAKAKAWHTELPVKLFNLIDADDSGDITQAELIHLMEDSGIPDFKAIIADIKNGCDEDGDGKINLQEFTNMFEAKFKKDIHSAEATLLWFEGLTGEMANKKPRTAGPPWLARVVHWFNIVDINLDGILQTSEINELMRFSGVPIKEATDLFMEDIRPNADGEITMTEVTALFIRKFAEDEENGEGLLWWFEDMAAKMQMYS